MAAVTHSNQGIKGRRLLRASQYVQKQWLPVNQDLLRKIRSGLDDGVYELDLTFLIDDLKLDYGIFLSCLKELALMLKGEMGTVPELEDPVKLFHFSGYDRLKTVLLEPGFCQNRHDLEAMTVEQSARLKESVISVSAVEVLFREKRLDVQQGFSIALLRQLGLTLVAWNYPTVYQRALAASENQSLDDGIVDQLGFSAQSLALQVLYDWGIVNAFDAEYFADGHSELYTQDSLNSVRQLVHLCEVGETLARACHPDVHPPKIQPWTEAKEVILEIIGDAGLRVIQAQVLENARAYLENFPGHFDDIQRMNPDACRRRVPKAGELNGHSKHCTKKVKALLNQVYSDLQAGDDKRAIAKLVKQVIPHSGFYAGAIFIVDPLSGKLVPRVHINNPRLISVRQIVVDGLRDSDSPIVAAFQCSSPIVENVLDPKIGYVSYAAGVLGNRQRAGVLYLEMEDISFEASSTNSLATFKAIRQAFCDCLKLN